MVTTTSVSAALPLDASVSFCDIADQVGKPAVLLRDDASAAHLSPAFHEYAGRFELGDDSSTWLHVIEEGVRSATEASILAGVASGAPFVVKTRVRDRSGEHHSFSLHVAPLREPGLWLATLRDLAHRTREPRRV